MTSHLTVEIPREKDRKPLIYMTTPVEVVSCENNAFARATKDGCNEYYHSNGYDTNFGYEGAQLYGDWLFSSNHYDFASAAKESVKRSIASVKSNGIEMVPGSHVLTITLETKTGLYNVRGGSPSGAGFFVDYEGMGAASTIKETSGPTPSGSSFLIWKDDAPF
ncbi:hypothetical protein J4198_000649 [Salmonella enterica]|nr:hypothetical protein [Salmonella enterica]